MQGKIHLAQRYNVRGGGDTGQLLEMSLEYLSREGPAAGGAAGATTVGQARSGRRRRGRARVGSRAMRVCEVACFLHLAVYANVVCRRGARS